MADNRQKVRNEETGQRYEMVNNAWKPIYSDAEDKGVIDTLLISAGKNMSDLGNGAHRLLMEVVGDEYGLEQLRRQQRQDQEAFDELQRERPGTTMIGQMLPGVAAGVLTGGIASIGGLGARAAVGLEAGASALQGGVEYREDLGSQGVNALLGGFFGGVGGAGGEAINRVRGASRGVTEAREQLQRQMVRNQEQVLDAVRASRAAEGVISLPGMDGKLALEIKGHSLAEIGKRTDELGEAARAMLSKPAADGTVEFNRLTSRAEQLGIKLTNGQLADDVSLRQLEASLGSNPLTSRLEGLRKQSNRARVNQTFGRALGIEGDTRELTEGMIGDVFNELEDEFGRIGAQLGTVEIDEAFVEGLEAIQTRNIASPVRSPEAVEITNKMLDIATVGADGKVTIGGGQLMNWRSDINRKMRQASIAGDGNLSMRLRETLQVLDDAVVREAGPDTAVRYINARSRYRLADAMDQTNVIKNGNVMTGRAASVMKNRYQSEFRRGNQYGAALSQDLLDAFDVLRISNRFGDIVGDSGTATRMAIPNLLNNPGSTLTGWMTAGAGEVAIRMGGTALSGPLPAAALTGAGRGLTGAIGAPAAAAVASGEAARAIERSISQ